MLVRRYCAGLGIVDGFLGWFDESKNKPLLEHLEVVEVLATLLEGNVGQPRRLLGT